MSVNLVKLYKSIKRFIPLLLSSISEIICSRLYFATSLLGWQLMTFCSRSHEVNAVQFCLSIRAHLSFPIAISLLIYPRMKLFSNLWNVTVSVFFPKLLELFKTFVPSGVSRLPHKTNFIQAINSIVGNSTLSGSFLLLSLCLYPQAETAELVVVLFSFHVGCGDEAVSIFLLKFTQLSKHMIPALIF